MSSVRAVQAAIYCALTVPAPHEQVDAQTQEMRCRELASSLGLHVGCRHVFVDCIDAESQLDQAQSGWERMLASMKAREFSHLLLYLPRMLLTRPQRCADLLRTADAYDIQLHAHPDSLECSAPDPWPARRSSAEQALRSLGGTARRGRVTPAPDPAPTGVGRASRRDYGYGPGMKALVEDEAAVVAEIFSRYLAGDSPRAIALDLNARRVPAAFTGRWTPGRVLRVLDAPRYAGIEVSQGRVIQDARGRYRLGTWPACVGVEVWERAQILRRQRAVEQTQARQPVRRYLLSGLVACSSCGFHLVGSTIGDQRVYGCTALNSAAAACDNRIDADALEDFVQALVLARLERGLPADASRRWAPQGAARAGQSATSPWPLSPGHASAGVSRSLPDRRSEAEAETPTGDVPTGPRTRLAWAGWPFGHKRATLESVFEVVFVKPGGTRGDTFHPNRIDAVVLDAGPVQPGSNSPRSRPG